MSAQAPRDAIHTRIWEEEPAPDDPFAADACHCRGYDVYGDLLQRVSYIEYLYLLFLGERPQPAMARLLEILAVAIANPGPRDASVHAAMAAGVGGSPAASSLMAALATGAGASGGAREVYRCMELLQRLPHDLAAWRDCLRAPLPPARAEVWPAADHPPGFEPHARACRRPVAQTLQALASLSPNGHLAWLHAQRRELEALAGAPLAMTGVIAGALVDLGLSPEAGEMLTLLLRLPGAAAHALEQQEQGFRRFPFFAIAIENDPGPTRAKDPA